MLYPNCSKGKSAHELCMMVCLSVDTVLLYSSKKHELLEKTLYLGLYYKIRPHRHSLERSASLKAL